MGQAEKGRGPWVGICPTGEGRWGVRLFNVNTFHPLGRVPSGNGAELGPDSHGKKEGRERARERGNMDPLQSGSGPRGRTTFPELVAKGDSCCLGPPPP